jgi:hypothetical protein
MNRQQRSFVALALVGSFLGGVLSVSGASGPGKHFFEVQAALIEKFDQDGNQRLDAAEREAMRVYKDPKSAKRKKDDDDQLPPKFVAKYDTNKNGDMDDHEWGPAIAKEVAVIVKRFDADESGKLDDTERKDLVAAMKKGEYEGLYGYFAGQAAKDPKEEARRRRKGPEYLEKNRQLLAFDLDGDGLASAAELEAIRESRRETVESKE